MPTATLAVTFDVDGTLYPVFRQKLKVLAWTLRYPRILSRFSETVEELRGERHKDLRAELARRVGAKVGVNESRARQALNHVVWGAYPASFNPRTPYPAVEETITSMRLPRAIVSDYDADEKLRRMGLDQGWAAVVSCERLGALKPLPDGLLAAAETLGVEPENILHIGDREDCDEVMAQAAGARCWLLGRDFRNWTELRPMLEAL